MSELYIGLMSGTSLDGIDAALVDIKDNKVDLIAFEYQPFSSQLKKLIEEISKPEALISLKDYGSVDVHLGSLFADAVNTLLAKAQISASAIKAIGSHGQTIYHAPDNAKPFSLQIGDPNTIAENTGITTVSDFRRRDIAVNGQGAPLVPAFHQAVFSHPGEHRCILNIGGIANITVLPADHSSKIIGFDTGPGNTLMDQWIQKHHNLDYDKNGEWAKSGTIRHDLVRLLKEDRYFQASPPKSTGKEYFSLTWVDQKITTSDYQAEDIQASLCFLTVITICDAIKKFASHSERVMICGGGAHNEYLIQLIQENLNIPATSTKQYGINPDHVEAMAFAWLAKQTLNNLPSNLKEVTGARKSVVLGGIYHGDRKESH
ncbi:MAG: anhydro-N-acetylmuramic acid kinase [Methylococcaceae bacterium]